MPLWIEVLLGIVLVLGIVFWVVAQFEIDARASGPGPTLP